MHTIDTNLLAPIPIDHLRTLSGVELFKRVIAGDLPAPQVCGVANEWMLEIEEGRALWEASPPANFVNPMGGVHGGWAMTVLDTALGCAVHSVLPAGTGYTTMEVKTNLTRAPKVGERYLCEGTVLTAGRRTATAEAKLLDAQDRIVAFGTTTCLILEF